MKRGNGNFCIMNRRTQIIEGMVFEWRISISSEIISHVFCFFLFSISIIYLLFTFDHFCCFLTQSCFSAATIVDLITILPNTALKVFKYGIFLVRISPYLDWRLNTVFSPNAEKYGPEKLRTWGQFLRSESTAIISLTF